jgi:hypothetical protein
LESWVPRVLTYTEGNTEASVIGEDVEAHRSHQAVACRKRCTVELGKPQRLQSQNLFKEYGWNHLTLPHRNNDPGGRLAGQSARL